MVGLIKLILGLLVVTVVVVYGGDIWNKTKEKITGFTDPELQKAAIYKSLKDDFGKVGDIIKELTQDESNLKPEQKSRLQEAAKLIEESKNNIDQVEQNDSTTVEKAFENLNDLKQGIQSVFSEKTSTTTQTTSQTQNCQCSEGNN